MNHIQQFSKKQLIDWFGTPDYIFLIGYTSGSLDVKLKNRLFGEGYPAGSDYADVLSVIKQDSIRIGITPLYKDLCIKEKTDKITKSYKALFSYCGWEINGMSNTDVCMQRNKKPFKQ